MAGPEPKLPFGEVAIVGGGLVGLTAHATLRHGGVEPSEVAVFGTDPDRGGRGGSGPAAIRQRRMHSESDGTARRRRSRALPCARRFVAAARCLSLATVFNRYHPTVDKFLAHVAALRECSGWDRSFSPARISRVDPVANGYRLGGRGPFRHVLLALGHPGLAVPEELAGVPRVVHAYELHEYGDRVAVVCAGMAAAIEWLNALAAGASVVSVRRREPERRPLNVPREVFTRRGLAAYHRTSPTERSALLAGWLAPSYPPGRAWDEPVEAADASGGVSASLPRWTAPTK